MKRFYTRSEIQTLLSSNPLKAPVSYLDREGSPVDNYILYMRMTPRNALRADNGVHIRKVNIQVVHLHRKKLDSIEEFMIANFGIEPSVFNVKQEDTDFWGTYYEFECFTKGSW